MTQPSGRTAEEILDEFRGDIFQAINSHPYSSYQERAIAHALNEAQRQLFNALLEIVGEDIEPDRKFGYSYQDAGKNELRTELRERLRVFFGQDGETK